MSVMSKRSAVCFAIAAISFGVAYFHWSSYRDHLGFLERMKELENVPNRAWDAGLLVTNFMDVGITALNYGPVAEAPPWPGANNYQRFESFIRRVGVHCLLTAAAYVAIEASANTAWTHYKGGALFASGFMAVGSYVALEIFKRATPVRDNILRNFEFPQNIHAAAAAA